MKFERKVRATEEGVIPRKPDNKLEDVGIKFVEYVQKMPRAWFLLLLILVFVGLFALFKWWNRGGVTIASGDNIINMTIGILWALLLDTLWDFNNPEEGMGWGGM